MHDPQREPSRLPRKTGAVRRRCRAWMLAGMLASMVVPGRPIAAAEGRTPPLCLQPGVLELAGTTAVSVSYQNESGGVRETTQLRVTPSVGYFVMAGLEVLLSASYVMDIVHNEDAVRTLYHDKSHTFLFTLGPAYNVYQLSDVFVPYAGLLLGTYYQHVSTETLGVSASRSDLQFALGLAAGMRWLLTENLALRTGVQYVHGFRESDVGSTNYLGLEIGISFFIPTWPSVSRPDPSRTVP